MAAANIETCGICFEEYDSSTHQSVLLPCSHEFCLFCLVRLKTGGKLECPQCRHDSSLVDLPTFPGMEALAAALQVNHEEKNHVNMDKKKKPNDCCEIHSFPFDFWVPAKEDFFCKRCAAEDKGRSEFVVIEDAIPQIRRALNTNVSKVTQKVEEDMKSLDKINENLVRKRNSVREFIQAAKVLEGNLDQKIGEVGALRAKKLDSSVQMQRVKGRVNNIQGPEDLGAVMECKSTLKKMGAASSIAPSELPQTLLCDIACNYVEKATPGNPPSRAAFIKAMRKGSIVAPVTTVESSPTASSLSDDGSSSCATPCDQGHDNKDRGGSTQRKEARVEVWRVQDKAVRCLTVASSKERQKINHFWGEKLQGKSVGRSRSERRSGSDSRSSSASSSGGNSRVCRP